tara:strand:+ start:242 stop:442 length:201 start_codon:yes stop_codon:yes gene_type:complete
MKEFFERFMIITHYLFWIVGFFLIMLFNNTGADLLLLFIVGAIFSSLPALLWYLFFGKPRWFPWDK